MNHFLAASAYGRRCVGLRPTPKFPTAGEKTSGTQGSERPRETNIVDLPGVNLKKTFTRVIVAIVLRL